MKTGLTVSLVASAAARDGEGADPHEADTRLRIDLWVDPICPWCLIGMTRLMQAASIIGIAPEVRLRGFRLHPEWPVDGLSWRDFQMRRHLPDPVFDRIAQVARAEGIDLDFSRIVRVPDTAPLHRLLLAAQPHGLALRLYRAFAQAYFFDGINLADRDTVLAVAASAGLDPKAAGLALEDPDLTALLEADEAEGRVLGIQGVPFLLAKGRALPGAVSPSAYQTLLQRLTARPG